MPYHTNYDLMIQNAKTIIKLFDEKIFSYYNNYVHIVVQI